MIQLELSRRFRLVFGLLLSFLLIALVQLGYEYIERKAQGGIYLHSAVQLSTGQSVNLPFRWLNSAGMRQEQTFKFEFRYEEPSLTPLFLYIPRYEQQLRVQLNGFPIDATALRRAWAGPLEFNSVIMGIPPGLLFKGANDLRLTVATGPLPAGSLSSIYIGEWEALHGIYQLDKFVELDLKWLLLGILGMLFLISLIFTATASGKGEFGWLAITLGCILLLRVGIFAQFWPDIVLLVPYFFLLMPLGSAAYLGFCMLLAGKPAPQWLLVTGGLISLGCLLLVFFTPIALRAVALGIAMPVMMLAIFAASFVVVRLAWRDPNPETTLLLIGAVLMLVGMAHDILVRAGILDAQLMVPVLSTPIWITGITIVVMRRQISIASALRRSKQDLETRLTQREQALSALFEEKRQLAEQTAMEQERSRITSELHDGVAGHLTTITALCELHVVDHQEIRQAAKHALDELRMIINAFSTTDNDLHLTLSVIRERCFNPLARAGIDLQWSLSALPENVALSPTQALNVLRILQEALTNAVRHGEPKQISITGRQQGGRIEVEVVNAGGKGFDPHVFGYGIRNMKARAAALPQGKLELIPMEDGARLILSFSAPVA